MSDINFTVTERGYEITEVNKYITMIQQEYANAVAWGEEMEKKLQEIKTQTEDLGLYFTIDENNHSEVIDKIFAELTATVSKVKADAEAKSKEIIDKANEKSRVIVRQAMENSVELRTQNSIVMKNLKSISDMIDVILDKASQ